MRGVPKKVYSSSGCSSCESVDARCGRGASGGAIQPCRLVGARAGPAGGEERTSSRVIRLMVCRTEGMLGGDACRACRQRYQSDEKSGARSKKRRDDPGQWRKSGLAGDLAQCNVRAGAASTFVRPLSGDRQPRDGPRCADNGGGWRRPLSSPPSDPDLTARGACIRPCAHAMHSFILFCALGDDKLFLCIVCYAYNSE